MAVKSTNPVIPGEPRASAVREGNPGGQADFASRNVITVVGGVHCALTWVPFPSLCSAGNDRLAVLRSTASKFICDSPALKGRMN